MVYFYLILGLVILLLGGKFLVDGASAIALKFGLTPGLVGLTVVAFGTSAPELLVSINAALKGSSDIAIGNVVGSNISNISLVLGLSALFYPIIIQKSVLKLDYLMVVLTSILFFVFAYNGMVSRLEGIVLFVIMVLVNFYFFRVISRTDNQEDGLEEYQQPFWKGLGLLILGIVGLYFGSDLLVDSAVKISKTMGISERVIGVTVIAVGTSLPELVTSIIAAINKKTDIAIGNILGSNIMNILAIVGITAIVLPIPVSEVFLKQDFIWMIGITLLLFPVLRTRLKISKIEGLFLVLVYGLYIFSIL